jgi:hypothetical protein
MATVAATSNSRPRFSPVLRVTQFEAIAGIGSSLPGGTLTRWTNWRLVLMGVVGRAVDGCHPG